MLLRILIYVSYCLSQSPSNFGLMRNAGERIAPVDKEGFHRRVGRLEQSFTEPRHAQRSCARRSQVIAAQRRPVPTEETARVVTGASARMAAVTGDAWYASDRARCTPNCTCPDSPAGTRLGPVAFRP